MIEDERPYISRLERGVAQDEATEAAAQNQYEQALQDYNAPDPNWDPLSPAPANDPYVPGSSDNTPPDPNWDPLSPSGANQNDSDTGGNNQQDDKVVSPNNSGNVPVAPVAVFDDGEGEVDPGKLPGGGGSSPPPESATPGSGGGTEPVPEPVPPSGEAAPVPVEPISPQIQPNQLAGKTPAEIDQMARSMGLQPMGPDPMNGQGSYIDPVTGEQRILIHPYEDPPEFHVNDPSGNRLDINGNVVDPSDPAAHLPLKVR